MKIIEYGYYDIASNENETKECLEKAIHYHPKTISVLPYYLRTAKLAINNHKIALSSVVDYPFGLSDSESRVKLVESSIKNGANIIEMVSPAHLLCNRRYDKFRKELEINIKLCEAGLVELRYILEYKLFNPELLYKVSSILSEFKIYTIYPSANYLIDNISDNLLAAMLISQKHAQMNIIVNGSAWTDDHINMLFNNKKIYGYKTSNIYTLEKIYKKSQNLS
jgi:deoxyribose-phosphate aldolase